MKVYFDQCTPKRIKRHLVGHEVRTAPEMNWKRQEDGPLLNKVEKAGFDVMVTGDKRLFSQQNLEGRKLAIVALGTNNWKVLRENIAPIVAAVDQAKPGSFKQMFVEHTKVQQKPSQGQKPPGKAKLEFFSDVHKPKPGIKH